MHWGRSLGARSMVDCSVSEQLKRQNNGCTHHIKVLVIDDDSSVCKTVGLLLEDHGYRPRTFTDPEKAVQSAEEESCQVALVDLRMPKIDGVDVVQRLKDLDPHMCVIVMTAYPDLDSATETMRRGATDYIAKPFKQEGADRRGRAGLP